MEALEDSLVMTAYGKGGCQANECITDPRVDMDRALEGECIDCVGQLSAPLEKEAAFRMEP